MTTWQYSAVLSIIITSTRQALGQGLGEALVCLCTQESESGDLHTAISPVLGTGPST